MEELMLELKGVEKYFGGIHALKKVDFSLKKGEIHALLGENGAGKSTLVKIITGVHKADSGDIFLQGKKVVMNDPIDARKKGIGVIYQELSLINSLTVGENIYLGHEPSRKHLGLYDRRKMYEDSQNLLRQFDIDVDATSPIHILRPGQKRIIEIVKALALNAKILLLDEPTTGMSQKEIDALFCIMDLLRKKQVTMIYISHYLDEVFRICDSATVLRDGKVIGTYPVASITPDILVKDMIGHDVKPTRKKERGKGNEELLRLVDYKTGIMREPVSFSLKKGEILGITGIIGAGKSELANSIFGVAGTPEGKLFYRGKDVSIRSTTEARKNQIALIPEDRKTEGLFLKDSIADNLMIVHIHAVEGKGGFLDRKKASQLAMKIGKEVHILPLIPEMTAGNLSGGNQQKVVIGKWLSIAPDLIIMDEPTRGIDVGAKSEIHQQILALSEKGKGVLVFSSEYQELINLCDRILVLRQGKIVGEFDGSDVTGEQILSLSLGGK